MLSYLVWPSAGHYSHTRGYINSYAFPHYHTYYISQGALQGLILHCRQKKQATIHRIIACFIRFCISVNYYLLIAETTPEPTVCPPSRIANLRPSSIAIGVISLTLICVWSPGITISVPLSSSIEPVTSVVLK